MTTAWRGATYNEGVTSAFLLKFTVVVERDPEAAVSVSRALFRQVHRMRPLAIRTVIITAFPERFYVRGHVPDIRTCIDWRS